MKNPYFQFKQFTIRQEACAMKVGTDGVLLGAWCSGAPAERILDIGTGTGVIALMLAQRTGARIDAVEIDPAAAKQAVQNAESSPWKDRIHIYRQDFISYRPVVPGRYDRIVSNPPYFDRALLPPDSGRMLARHTTRLSFAELFSGVHRLLAPQGTFSLIYPAEREAETEREATGQRFFLQRKTYVSGRKGLPPKRILAEWGFSSSGCTTETLFIEEENHSYTPEFTFLLRDFYLKM